MKIKSKIKKLLLEISAMVLAVFAMLLSFLADLSIFNIPDCFILRIQNTEDLLFNLFTVQATVTTMSIAIIALISGIISDSVYGISVTRFVIQLKPRILKHKRLIIFSLIVTFLNYFVVSYNLYNTSIAIFLLSIIISIILVKDVFVIFLGRKEIKKEMETYILENYQAIGIDNFKTSLLESDDISKKTFLKENCELIKKIFEKEVSVSTDEIKSELLVELETILSDTFNIIYQKKNSDALILILNFISELYEIANEEDNSVPLTIWDNISRNYFKSLRLLSEEQLYNSDFFYRLHSQLYQNLKIKETDDHNIAINCYDIKYYNTWIYYFLIVNNNNDSNQYDRERLLKFLYKNITGIMFYNKRLKSDENKKYLLLSEWCFFVKALIDEGEKAFFKDEFISEYRYYIAQNSYQTVFVVSCIYLYYIGCREDLVHGKDSQRIAKEIIEENHDNIQNILYRINLYDFLTNNLNFINEQMRTWEVIPDKEAKCIIMDAVIDDFFVFTTLKNHWNNDAISKIIQALIGKNTFMLYTHYFGKTDDNFINLFHQYNSVFFDEKEEESSIKKYSNILKDVLNAKYKLEEIEAGKKNIITDDSRIQFEKNIRKTFESIITENSYLFEQNTQNNKEYKQVSVCLGEFNLPSLIINDSKLDDHIKNFIHSSIINTYIYIIAPKLNIKEKKHDDGSIQETLIKSLNNLSINGDTFIGNREVFWNENDKNLLSKYTEGMRHIKYPDGYNKLFIINHNLIHCSISNLEIKLRDLNQKEIEKMCKKTDDGKLCFNVTNDIYIPFESDELNEHINRIRKKIYLYATVKYRLDSDKVGAGINIVMD